MIEPILPSSPIPIPFPHALVTESHYADQSDHHAELVQESTWQLHKVTPRLELFGNLITVLNPADNSGFVWIRLASTVAVRTWDTQANLVIERQESGQWQMIPGPTELEHPWVVIPFTGGTAGRTMALHDWQRKVHPCQEHRDGLFLTNTWGDRGRGDKMNEAFLLAEIDRAAELGVEVVQIDDGWQSGRTCNTTSAEEGGVWDSFWKSRPDYWVPDPERFPRGLEPVAARAKERGVRLGLWFAPDTSEDAANWERDAEVLLKMHKDFGIDFFKLDGVKLVSPLCVQRFHALLDRVQQMGNGENILFDLDTTAETRLGFWGRCAGVAIFVQNRYSDWITYYPHNTLRALWALSQTVLPTRLRMEFLNPERNAEIYGDDPARPALYDPAYLFASVMLSSPLGWFENTGLSNEFIQRVRPLVDLWKEHRQELHNGWVLPIGEKPNGFAWTGFAVLDGDRRLRHLVIFRENHRDSTHTFRLPVEALSKVQLIAGAGEIRVQHGESGDCEIHCSLPDARTFCWVRLE